MSAPGGILTCPHHRPLVLRILARKGDTRELPPVGELCQACRAREANKTQAASQAPATVKESRRFRHCIHLGEVTQAGKGCQGTNRYRCTLEMFTPDVCHLRECQSCPNYELGP